MKSSRSTFVDLRGVRYHVREWGASGATPLFMLHGWADASATFQFLVDALGPGWHVVAPDWRGFGRSARTGDTYWFADYLGDLDALLTRFSPDDPAFVLGHSMGGNVAGLYAGVRPARVRKLVLMDAFGLPDRLAEQAPGRYEKWLNQLGTPSGFRSYPDKEAFAARLMRENPRLDLRRAVFLATHLTEPDGEGGVRLAADPAHRSVHPVLYRRAEAQSCWRRVRAPVLGIVQADPSYRRALGITDAAHRAATECFPDFREIEVSASGHNLHHDQPELVARIVEEFLLSSAREPSTPDRRDEC